MVMDWGISREMGQKELMRPNSSQVSKSSHKTQMTYFSEFSVVPTVHLGKLLDEMSGDKYIMGTPAYMAPEQITDPPETFNERTDIYALGSTLYTLMTCSQAFEGETVDDLLQMKLDQKPIPPIQRNKSIPRKLNAIILKAMELDQDERYKTVGDLIKAINNFQENNPVSVKGTTFAKRIINAFRGYKQILSF